MKRNIMIFKPRSFHTVPFSTIVVIFKNRQDYKEIVAIDFNKLRSMAGREGFEPPEALTSTVFKTAAIDHSAISRWRRHSDSNRGIKALQAHALPLGYVAMVPETGLEPARKNPRDFKSLVSTYSTTRARASRTGRSRWLNLNSFIKLLGAGNGDRTRGPNLGKVVLYH